jgi:hypothetical protein
MRAKALPVPMADGTTTAAIALTTLWLAYLRPGTLRMTRPRMLFFTSDRQWDRKGRSKIVVIALLYATAKRKVAVETMWVTVEHEGQTHVLPDWFYKASDEAFPSGLNVGEEGRALYHHFYLPRESPLYPWPAGNYTVSVWAKVAGQTEAVPLFVSPVLSLPAGMDKADVEEGFSMNWNPLSGAYELSTDRPSRFGP